MDFDEIDKWMTKLVGLFGLIEKLHRPKKCRKCGYVFDGKKALRVCKECEEKFYSFSERRQQKLIALHNRQPYKCSGRWGDKTKRGLLS